MQPNITTVLMGFNPVSLARNTPIEKWHKTCREVSSSTGPVYILIIVMMRLKSLCLCQVFVELEIQSVSSDKAVILNPVVGPEPITGGSGGYNSDFPGVGVAGTWRSGIDWVHYNSSWF